MRIAVSGASGLIGSVLAASLRDAGHDVIRMVRANAVTTTGAQFPEFVWKPEGGHWGTGQLEGVDAIINLAGEPIAQRWTAEKKAQIRNSRVQGTRTLAEAITTLKRPPRVWINSSAIGYYGNRGAELLNEDSAPGLGFLPEICQDWEAVTEPAAHRGVRVVHMRTGIVLSRAGGALAKMLLPFQLGLGGVIGTGQQYLSWIGLEDQVNIFHYVLENDSMTGPVNAVAPSPVTNREYTKTLGKVLNRPTIFPMPAFAVKLVFGKMGEHLLLSSTRVMPKRLLTAGYHFRYPELSAVLSEALGRAPADQTAIFAPPEASRKSIHQG